MNRPVSSTLLGEVRDLVRQRGLVVWLDPAGTFTGFVDDLDPDVAPVARYRGSFTSLLRETAPHAREVTPTPFLVHLDGLDEASVQKTPALELAAAGFRWHRDLKALVTASAAGRVSPAELAPFVASVRTLDEADRWLADKLEDGKGGFTALLRGMGLPEIVGQLASGKGGLASRVAHAGDLASLWDHLERRIGLPRRWWEPLTPSDGAMSASDVAYTVASWALCVEYIHDPAPRTPKAAILIGVERLPAAVVEACRQLASALRQRDDYKRTADETEARIHEERGVDPRTLGRIDTFRFEENAVLLAALADLDAAGDTAESFAGALTWADGRAERSYWLRRDDTRKMAWRIVLDVARLGQSIATAGLLPRVLDLAGAVAWYTAHGARVDQLHRVLEQDCSLLLKSELPEFDKLVAAVEDIREVWATWANDCALAFNHVCQREGFLPESRLQQRAIFDDVIVPALTDGEVTAFFMVDALRYEMAEALRPTFEGAGTTIELSARLAELPTVTEVGMNALPPVAVGGKLSPVLADGSLGGFQLGEYRVKDPTSRKRAIQARAGGGTCPWMSLQEVTDRDAGSLRKAIAQARVVIVHSQEIDTAGESGLGLTAFEPVLRQVREGWLRLREAGVRRFVITADHGFLLLRDPTELPHGLRSVPSRRHVITSVLADEKHEVRVPLRDLGYLVGNEQLMMPSGIQVFRRFQTPQGFVHGGNSLQERVIPVLVVTSKAQRGAEGVRYEIRLAERPGIAGMHRLQVTVAAIGDLFPGRREVDLVLRAQSAVGVGIEVWVGNDRAEGQLRVPVGEATELFFRLRGGSVAKVGLEVACGGDASADPVHAGFFSVEGATASTGTEGLQEWLAGVADTDHRQVLAHLVAHGSITEAEVASMVGTPARARRFGTALDVLVPDTAPIRVRVATVAGVKRYVREEG